MKKNIFIATAFLAGLTISSVTYTYNERRGRNVVDDTGTFVGDTTYGAGRVAGDAVTGAGDLAANIITFGGHSRDQRARQQQYEEQEAARQGERKY